MNRIEAQFVEFIPEQIEEGVIYISREYKTASHLCCCGCGWTVATPLNQTYGWSLIEANGVVSLHPSIGNRFPCHSHYLIKEGCVEWLGE
jgi:hypothetical protein